MTLDTPIHIVCGTDDNYMPHLAALLTSIHASKGSERIHVHGLLDSVSDDSIAAIESMGLDLTYSWYRADDDPALELPPLLHISRATYLRLIADKVLPKDLERVLYLDIDMIVTASLLPLWNTDLEDRWCAAVTNPHVDLEDFAKLFGLLGRSDYFNAGMILFDLDVVRQRGLFASALNRLHRDPDVFDFADQDALNIIYWGRWKAVDATWNFQRMFLMKQFRYPSDKAASQLVPNIIHYTQQWKPWRDDEWHPLRWPYLSALSKTPFDTLVRQAGGIGARDKMRAWLSYRKFLLGKGLQRCSATFDPDHRPLPRSRSKARS